jgi:phospholipid/cholesterol/gamma-HCH transport system permease protein
MTHTLPKPTEAAPVLERTLDVPVVKTLVRTLNETGERMRFYLQTLAGVPVAVTKYPGEVVRHIAVLGMGLGMLATIGGSTVVVAVTCFSDGALIGAQGYEQLQSIGVDGITGAIAAFWNPRIIQQGTPLVTMAATVGAAAAAELGAMRINEEIDALEVIGIRTVSYLASTRLIAGMIAIVPIWCGSLIAGYGGSYLATTLYHNSNPGVYNHYFNLFMHADDIVKAGMIEFSVAMLTMLFCTQQGYNAKRGPAGVGEAVGVAVRSSVAFASLAMVCLVLAVWGINPNIHLAQ